MKRDKVLEIIEKMANEKKNNTYVVQEALEEIQSLVIEEENKISNYKKQEYLIYGLCLILFLFPLFSFSFLPPLNGFIPLFHLTYRSTKRFERYKKEYAFIRRANINGLI